MNAIKAYLGRVGYYGGQILGQMLSDKMNLGLDALERWHANRLREELHQEHLEQVPAFVDPTHPTANGAGRSTCQTARPARAVPRPVPRSRQDIDE